MKHLRVFVLLLAAVLMSLPLRAQGTKAGDATTQVNGTTTITLSSTFGNVLKYQATGVNYRWYSSNTNVATVPYYSSFESCTVQGKAAGACKVWFSASFYIDGFYRTYEFYWDVTVSGYTGGGSSGGGTAVVEPTGATVYPSALTLEVGQAYDLGFTVSPSNATFTSEWVSYYKNILTVDKQGRVTAVGVGTANANLWIFDSKQNSVDMAVCEVTVVPATRMLDEASTEAPLAAAQANVTVNRPLTAGKWNTLCLPFAMSKSQMQTALGNDVEVAAFAGYKCEKNADGQVTSITVNFNDVEEMEANHPYIVRTSSDVTEFTVENVEVVPAENPATVIGDTDTEARGSFIGTFVAETTVPDKCLFISDNKFWFSTGKTKIKAFRAYLDLQDVLPMSASSRIQMAVGGEATDVRELTLQHPENGKYYDLSGRQVAEDAKGLYIVNGKKHLKR